MFTIKGCSLIRGVHYERFHCISFIFKMYVHTRERDCSPIMFYYYQHDGSLVVWDLTEPSSLHRSHSVGEHSWLLRYPTYNTGLFFGCTTYVLPLLPVDQFLNISNRFVVVILLGTEICCIFTSD